MIKPICKYTGIHLIMFPLRGKRVSTVFCRFRSSLQQFYSTKKRRVETVVVKRSEYSDVLCLYIKFCHNNTTVHRPIRGETSKNRVTAHFEKHRREYRPGARLRVILLLFFSPSQAMFSTCANNGRTSKNIIAGYMLCVCVHAAKKYYTKAADFRGGGE